MAALCGKILFSLGTHHGRANRPCEGDRVSEKPMLSDAAPHFNIGQNFHYNIDDEVDSHNVSIENQSISKLERQSIRYFWGLAN